MKARQVLSKALVGLAVLGSVSAAKADISWNGFGNVFYGHLLNEDFRTTGFESADPNFTSFSQFGLNVGGAITSDMDFAAQLVATGGNTVHSGFDLFAQWAFLNYRVGDSTVLRFGRQLFPLFIASEYARVGFLLPYRSIPQTVFGLYPFLAFDGAAAEHSWQLGDNLKLTAGIFGGTGIIDADVSLFNATYSGTNMYGAQLNLDGDGWRIHLQGHSIKSDYGVGGASYTAAVPTYTAGIRYDKHNFVTWAEYLFSESTDGTPATATTKFQEHKRAGYAMVGYRLGEFLPRYTYAYADASLGLPYGGGFGSTRFQMTTHTVGFNYQMNSQAVFKLDYEITELPTGQDPGLGLSRVAGEDSSSAVYAGISFIF